MRCRQFVAFLICWVLRADYSDCVLNKNGTDNKNNQHLLYPLEKKILGGLPVSLHQYPFNVQFINLDALCGGSILTKKAVLTAAHCFDNNRDIGEMTIVTNARFLLDQRGVRHHVHDYKLHEGYTVHARGSLRNDIAVILIQQEFQFNEHTQKATLCNTLAWMNENETFFATGWGETEYGKPVITNALEAAALQYVGKRRCMRWNKMKLGEDLFCLYGGGVRDTCRGDSGGPILWRGLLVGVTSHGRRCGSAPGMYANVAYFRRWIVDIVTSLTHKFCLS